MKAKKTQSVWDCVKSTPKEEGGGDTGWIDNQDPIRLPLIIHSEALRGKRFLCAALQIF
jgi:hypothetical protein